MCMREEDRINGLGIKAEITITALRVLPASLEKSAVQENTIPISLD